MGGDKVSRVEDWKRESCWYERLSLGREGSRELACGGERGGREGKGKENI